MIIVEAQDEFRLNVVGVNIISIVVVERSIPILFGY